MKNLVSRISLFIAAGLFSATLTAGVLPAGIQTNVAQSTVQSTWGWTECASFSAGAAVNTAATLAGCQGNYLAMAAYVNGSSDYAIFAGASYDDVTLDTGAGSHEANGVQWYNNDDSFPRSWGFTEVGEQTNRRNCDTNLRPNEGNALGMCWHHFQPNIVGGWALNNGSFQGLGGNWTRVLLVLDTVQPQGVPAPAGIGFLMLGLIGFGLRRRQS